MRLCAWEVNLHKNAVIVSTYLIQTLKYTERDLLVCNKRDLHPLLVISKAFKLIFSDSLITA